MTGINSSLKVSHSDAVLPFIVWLFGRFLMLLWQSWLADAASAPGPESGAAVLRFSSTPLLLHPTSRSQPRAQGYCPGNFPLTYRPTVYYRPVFLKQSSLQDASWDPFGTALRQKKMLLNLRSYPLPNGLEDNLPSHKINSLPLLSNTEVIGNYFSLFWANITGFAISVYHCWDYFLFLTYFLNSLFFLNMGILNMFPIEGLFPSRPTASLAAFLHFIMSSIFFTFSFFFITYLVSNFQLLLNLDKFLA